MNPVLVEAIRVRMREQTTEQLLELWTTNDRAMWSPEAFEAVRSLLAERGVKELPPQNDAAPVALPYSPRSDPSAEYWLGWLRPTLWICIGVAVAALPRLMITVWAVVPRWGRSVTFADVLDGGDALLWLELVLYQIVLPVLLVIGAIGALRLKSWARPALLAYAWASAVVVVAVSVIRVWGMRRYMPPTEAWMYNFAGTLESIARSLVLPAVLWVLLRRPEIRSLFLPVASGRAFEPLAANDSVPNPAQQ